MATRSIARRIRYVSRPRSRSRRKGFTLPLAVLGGFAPLAINAMADYQVGGVKHLAKGICVRTTGYMFDTGKFEPKYLGQGLWPIAIGILVHKMAGKLGVNRALGQAGVPFVRI